MGKKLSELTQNELDILNAVHFIRHLPKDYYSANFVDSIEKRNEINAIQRTSIRLISTGEASIIEHNERVSIERELKKAISHGHFDKLKHSSK